MTTPTTPLQTWTSALFDLLFDARAELGERGWAVFVSIACDRIGGIAAELVYAEIVRAALEDEQDAA